MALIASGELDVDPTGLLAINSDGTSRALDPDGLTKQKSLGHIYDDGKGVRVSRYDVVTTHRRLNEKLEERGMYGVSFTHLAGAMIARAAGHLDLARNGFVAMKDMSR